MEGSTKPGKNGHHLNKNERYLGKETNPLTKCQLNKLVKGNSEGRDGKRGERNHWVPLKVKGHLFDDANIQKQLQGKHKEGGKEVRTRVSGGSLSQ